MLIPQHNLVGLVPVFEPPGLSFQFIKLDSHDSDPPLL